MHLFLALRAPEEEVVWFEDGAAVRAELFGGGDDSHVGCGGEGLSGSA